jgi:hypothetical protein
MLELTLDTLIKEINKLNSETFDSTYLSEKKQLLYDFGVNVFKKYMGKAEYKTAYETVDILLKLKRSM